MPHQELEKKLSTVHNGQSCVVAIHDSEGNVIRYDCTFVQRETRDFALVLFSGLSLNMHNIKKTCSFSTSPVPGQPTVSCKAQINQKIADTIELTALEDIDPATLRQFFRVNLRVPITVSHCPDIKNKQTHWSQVGETIDISRTGILCILPQEATNLNELQIELALTDPRANTNCTGHIIRIKRLTKSRWLTAIHFDQINPAAADNITANCLQEQRRQIRDNIQTT